MKFGWLLPLLAAPGAISLATAEADFAAGRYAKAAVMYELLVEDHPTLAPLLHFNQAQALFAVDSLPQAAALYKRILPKLPETLRSRALTNLGVYYTQVSQPRLALAVWRQALLLDATNEAARFNYELLKRRQEKTPPPLAPPPPDDDGKRPAPQRIAEGNVEFVPFEKLTALEREKAFEELLARDRAFVQQLRKGRRGTEHYLDELPNW